ncbi:MAG TPA: hypothetical protein VKB96_18225 [Gammaproteobacteria bacterium]|nr:hypothetical protein [Gammaproteobacteria bacterium]
MWTNPSFKVIPNPPNATTSNGHKLNGDKSADENDTTSDGAPTRMRWEI